MKIYRQAYSVKQNGCARSPLSAAWYGHTDTDWFGIINASPAEDHLLHPRIKCISMGDTAHGGHADFDGRPGKRLGLGWLLVCRTQTDDGTGNPGCQAQ
jgi:hypothetical protein